MMSAFWQSALIPAANWRGELVVAHHGVDQYQVAVSAEGVEELLYDVQLLERSEIAGIDGVKWYAERLPVLHDRAHIVGQVPVSVSADSSGMGGEDGCGERRGLDSCGR